jgi:hypothetical protein
MKIVVHSAELREVFSLLCAADLTVGSQHNSQRNAQTRARACVCVYDNVSKPPNTVSFAY